MSVLQENRHKIVAATAGTEVGGQVASILRGRPGFSLEEQEANFQKVADLLKGVNGVKKARKLAKESRDIVRERAQEEADAEESEDVESPFDIAITAVEEALEALETAREALLDAQAENEE
jgi:hypothetical protein